MYCAGSAVTSGHPRASAQAAACADGRVNRPDERGQVTRVLGAVRVEDVDDGDRETEQNRQDRRARLIGSGTHLAEHGRRDHQDDVLLGRGPDQRRHVDGSLMRTDAWLSRGDVEDPTSDHETGGVGQAPSGPDRVELVQWRASTENVLEPTQGLDLFGPGPHRLGDVGRDARRLTARHRCTSARHEFGRETYRHALRAEASERSSLIPP